MHKYVGGKTCVRCGISKERDKDLVECIPTVYDWAQPTPDPTPTEDLPNLDVLDADTTDYSGGGGDFGGGGASSEF